VDKDITLVVGEMPDEKIAARSGRSVKPSERTANRLGLVLSELTAEQRRELRINGGLLIEEIRSATGRADLRPGDVILALIARGESVELRTVEQFNKLLAQVDKSANVTLLVRRGDQQTFVTLKGGVSEKRGE